MATIALKAEVDQIGPNTKKLTVSAQGQSHTSFTTSQSTWWRKWK